MRFIPKDRSKGKSFPFKTDPEAVRMRTRRSQHLTVAQKAQEFVNYIVGEGLMTEENEGDVRAACWAMASYANSGCDLGDYVLELEKVVVVGGVVYIQDTSSNS